MCLYGQWQQTSAPTETVNALQANDEVVLASTGESNFLVSSDHGETWTPSGTGLPPSSLKDIISVPGTQTFYAWTSDGIYKTENNGSIWTEVTTSIENLNFVYYFNGFLFAGAGYGANQGLNRSSDGGQSWDPITNGLTSNGVDCMAHDNDFLYAGLVGTGPGTEPGVFRSSDNGTNWEFASTGLVQDINGLATLGDRLYAYTYSFVYYSTDQGASWEYTSGLINGIPIIQIIPAGNHLLACQFTGPSKLENNSNIWEQWQEGMSTMYASAFTKDDVFAYCGIGSEGIWRRSLEELTGENELGAGKEKFECVLSPNPVVDIAHCRFDISQFAFCKIEMFDITGRSSGMLFKGKPASDVIQFDLSYLLPGIYFFTVETENQIIARKIVKL